MGVMKIKFKATDLSKPVIPQTLCSVSFLGARAAGRRGTPFKGSHVSAEIKQEGGG